MNNKEKKHLFTFAILSLSLLTVMAGAAVAPALNVIAEYFSASSPTLIQLIVSIPALFIVITNMIFPYLCRRFKSRTLVMMGLLIYTIGGCIAGMFNNIYLVLATRCLVGIGVGIIMPLSTGLLTYYYTRDKHDKLMGLSSAMNNMGGVIATLLSGMLATISWRASFLVYLMGLISIVLCALFMPNERMMQGASCDIPAPRQQGIFKQYYPFVIAMFILMFTFFVYPCNFAMETAAAGIIPQKYIAVIMAFMDFIAFFGGLAYVIIRRHMGHNARFFSPVVFLVGYLLLSLSGGWLATITGSALIGFANGAGIPFLMSTAAGAAGRSATTTVMPLLSAALYLAQFLTPAILSLFAGLHIMHAPYIIAMISSCLMILWAFTIRPNMANKQ